jgi:hypothetical protein
MVTISCDSRHALMVHHSWSLLASGSRACLSPMSASRTCLCSVFASGAGFLNCRSTQLRTLLVQGISQSVTARTKWRESIRWTASPLPRAASLRALRIIKIIQDLYLLWLDHYHRQDHCPIVTMRAVQIQSIAKA